MIEANCDWNVQLANDMIIVYSIDNIDKLPLVFINPSEMFTLPTCQRVDQLAA